MHLSQVAAQLYTVRDFCKTAPDLAQTLRKLRAIGYEAVQLSGVGPIPEAEIVKMLVGEGLTLCATHENAQTILDQPQAVVEKLKKLNCRYTAYPYPAGFKFGSMEEVDTLCTKLNAAGKLLHENGQVLTYHNHDIEFLKVAGKTVMEHIFERTAPAFLQGEPDTFWVQIGGNDPAAWCRRLAGRLPLLHLKDYKPVLDQRAQMAEIGNGVLDWPKIIAEAEASGCEWFIVEQDAFWMDNDPFRSLEISFAYIREKLACR
ncbi:MAG: sugar phosphate isomerase/epimerase [Lentisphaeria bacterium]|jgi:sugar phosphate isomerase/epimerase